MKREFRDLGRSGPLHFLSRCCLALPFRNLLKGRPLSLSSLSECKGSSKTHILLALAGCMLAELVASLCSSVAAYISLTRFFLLLEVLIVFHVLDARYLSSGFNTFKGFEGNFSHLAENPRNFCGSFFCKYFKNRWVLQ